MQIGNNEISSVEEIGTLSGHPVRLVRTKGGFWIAISRKRGRISEEALGAGSHPAIVKYNLEKQYPDFEPNMMKSENFVEPIVDKHSHFLPEELRHSGHYIFSVQTGSSIEFHITKNNVALAKAEGLLEESHLVIQNLKIPKEFSKGMAGATLEKAISCKVGLKLKKITCV